MSSMSTRRTFLRALAAAGTAPMAFLRPMLTGRTFYIPPGRWRMTKTVLVRVGDLVRATGALK